jgi:hypothetical protein
MCNKMHIITMTKQHTTVIPGTAPVDSAGAGAPENRKFSAWENNIPRGGELAVKLPNGDVVTFSLLKGSYVPLR